MKKSPKEKSTGTRHIKSLKKAVAGFTLGGWKLPDGRISLGSDLAAGVVVDEFPAKVEFEGTTYTLEEVEVFSNGFCNAEYV